MIAERRKQCKRCTWWFWAWKDHRRCWWVWRDEPASSGPRIKPDPLSTKHVRRSSRRHVRCGGGGVGGTGEKGGDGGEDNGMADSGGGEDQQPVQVRGGRHQRMGECTGWESNCPAQENWGIVAKNMPLICFSILFSSEIVRNIYVHLYNLV